MQGPSRAGDAQQGPLVERGESSKFLTTMSQVCHIVVISLSHRCHIVVTSFGMKKKTNAKPPCGTTQTLRPLRILEWRNSSMFKIKALMTNTKHYYRTREVKYVFIIVKHKHFFICQCKTNQSQNHSPSSTSNRKLEKIHAHSPVSVPLSVYWQRQG